MTITNALASSAVDSLSESLVWYEYLFGRKADARPMADVAELKLPGGGWVHVATDADRAGALALLADSRSKKIGSWEISGDVLYFVIKLPDSVDAAGLDRRYRRPRHRPACRLRKAINRKSRQGWPCRPYSVRR